MGPTIVLMFAYQQGFPDLLQIVPGHESPPGDDLFAELRSF